MYVNRLSIEYRYTIFVNQLLLLSFYKRKPSIISYFCNTDFIVKQKRDDVSGIFSDPNAGRPDQGWF